MTASLETQALELLSKALDKPAGQRETWVRAQAGDDEALAARVLELLVADAKASGLIMTGGAGKDAAEDPIPKEIGAYRITGLIGQGGMGAVYKGERIAGDFDHDVAIKVIRPGVLSETLIERFRHERQTLANLNHPHIARLFDGGDTDEGQPYIVMEYVDGQPITEWADRHQLSLNPRLDLFCDVCSAVRYAHQNLIIHRDITPSNVLVTSGGEIKLIDFGIAKPHDPDSTDAGPGSLHSLSFTPGYAAPERSKGAAANTLSDIFSLGKILEALLKESVCDRDLEAVIDRAVEVNPDNRYATVDALMDDIKSYRAGETVDARDGGASYRLNKFLGRHKLATAAALVAVTGLVTALGVTNFQYQRAEAALELSESRFSEVRGLTNFLLFDLFEDLSVLPGTLPVMNKVAEKANEYLEILSHGSSDDEATLKDLGIGHYRLAQVFTQSGGSNLGDPDKGIIHLEESVRILEELATRPDASEDIKLALAEARNDLGYILQYNKGEYERSGELLAGANAYFEAEHQRQPDDLDMHLRKALSGALLLYSKYQGSPEFGSEAEFNDLVEEFEMLLEVHPDNIRVMANLALYLRFAAYQNAYDWQDLSDNYIIPETDRVRFEMTLARAERSLQLFGRVLELEPDDPDYLYQYVWSAEALGEIGHAYLSWQGDFETLVADLAEAGASGGKAAVRQRYETAEMYEHLRRRADYVLAALDEADAILAKLEPVEGGQFTFLEAKFSILAERAYVVSSLQVELDEGIDLLRQASVIVSGFRDENPDYRNAHNELATLLNEAAVMHAIAQLVYGENRRDDICELVREADNIWTLSTERWGAPGDYASDVAATQAMLAEAECG